MNFNDDAAGFQGGQEDAENPSTSEAQTSSSNQDETGDNSVSSNEAEPKKKDDNQLLKVKPVRVFTAPTPIPRSAEVSVFSRVCKSFCS